MQLFSLHHCLLFFILTFTTAPVSALEICPTRAKLHQPVTLSCTSACSGSLMWNLLSNRGVVLAQCNLTSCWAKEGFSISHDQYLKGDFSLTITEADYSQRNVYVCECRDSDYAHVRLVIETVFTPVQMETDEDLKLKVSVPEPVEVIYKSDDAADEVICSVTNGSLQCKDDYRHRTSLTYPELTLRHMTPRDKGSYTIRDTKNNEDIQIYAVSVEDKPDVLVWVIPLILILLCCSVGAGIFLLYRKQLERRQQLVDQLVQEALGGTVDKIREVEKSLDQLQQQYNNTVYKDKVTVFCSDKRRQLLLNGLQQVDKLVQQAKGGKEEKIREVEKSLNQLQQQYNNTEYKDNLKLFCSEKREQLIKWRLLPALEPLQKHEEWKKEDTEHLEKELNRMLNLYWNSEHLNDVLLLCFEHRSQISWNRLQYSKEEDLMTKRTELNRKLLMVEQLVQQAKAGTKKKITEADKAIDELEQQYNYTEYSKQVSVLCGVKRIQLIQLYCDKGLTTQDSELSKKLQHVEKLVQKAKAGTKEENREAADAIDELELQYSDTEYSKQVSMFCDVKRKELNPLYSYKGLKRWNRQLYHELNAVEHIVKRTKLRLEKNISNAEEMISNAEEMISNAEEKISHAEEISEAEEKISKLELQYFTTEYSGRVSLFCMTKRAELYWCRLLHSDK
ncbi:myosin heavy chain, clone 203-like [Tachysurus fulvidraco]|uniref:myosin heavy chain, clone 203-like n=1 Tax=Tachysurus fulvidraco TaxID=1234273 RepID=UPI001FF01524|nr:myosin heavy chain, clone 203-like [Tachysurus fulvidraco]XP_047674455.1 myosin heavy chain, clone 203-like [Tachysurus fulvidraco]XP_047674456.1 myosin heavy chain, clone 203-like [Tachysurus fulvidraco]XP_047674457.1 myosin heavy chain, clone 203-like [Tachysurus fulvidraco]